MLAAVDKAPTPTMLGGKAGVGMDVAGGASRANLGSVLRGRGTYRRFSRFTLDVLESWRVQSASYHRQPFTMMRAADWLSARLDVVTVTISTLECRST